MQLYMYCSCHYILTTAGARAELLSKMQNQLGEGGGEGGGVAF